MDDSPNYISWDEITKMKKQDVIEALPLTILTVVGMRSIFLVLTSTSRFGVEQYLGLTLVGISIILFFVDRRVYKYVFGMTLLLGLVNLLYFTVSMVTYTFMGIAIQGSMLPIILLFFLAHKKDIKPIIKSLFGRNQKDYSGERESQTQGYRRRFEKLSNNEINIKLKMPLVPEAIEALKRIKIEREDKSNELDSE